MQGLRICHAFLTIYVQSQPYGLNNNGMRNRTIRLCVFSGHNDYKQLCHSPDQENDISELNAAVATFTSRFFSRASQSPVILLAVPTEIFTNSAFRSATASKSPRVKASSYFRSLSCSGSWLSTSLENSIFSSPARLGSTSSTARTTNFRALCMAAIFAFRLNCGSNLYFDRCLSTNSLNSSAVTYSTSRSLERMRLRRRILPLKSSSSG